MQPSSWDWSWLYFTLNTEMFLKQDSQHVTQLYTELKWLQMAARIKFMSLMLHTQWLQGLYPAIYLVPSIIQAYAPFQQLCHTLKGHLVLFLTHKAVSIQTAFMCGSTMMALVSKAIRDVWLNHKESLEDFIS